MTEVKFYNIATDEMLPITQERVNEFQGAERALSEIVREVRRFLREREIELFPDKKP